MHTGLRENFCSLRVTKQKWTRARPKYNLDVCMAYSACGSCVHECVYCITKLWPMYVWVVRNGDRNGQIEFHQVAHYVRCAMFCRHCCRMEAQRRSKARMCVVRWHELFIFSAVHGPQCSFVPSSFPSPPLRTHPSRSSTPESALYSQIMRPLTSSSGIEHPRYSLILRSPAAEPPSPT